MNAFPAIEFESPTQRYESLVRAANAIASCSDCDTAADVLLRELREVVAFDYLQLVAFENETKAVGWRLLYANGQRREAALADARLEGTPIGWAHEYQKIVVTPDWSSEAKFWEHKIFLNELGIASTCTLPVARARRRLGVLEVGSAHRHAYSDDEVSFLRLVSDQLALAIDAAVSSYLSQQAEDRLKLILDLTNQVVSNLDFQQLLRVISGSVRRVMRCDAAAIMLPEPDGQQLRVHALDFPDSKGF